MIDKGVKKIDRSIYRYKKKERNTAEKGTEKKLAKEEYE